MAIFSNLFGGPRLSADLAKHRIATLPYPKAALFYLMRPFLTFANPKDCKVKYIDYQSNLALFEMSALVFKKLAWSLIRSQPLVADMRAEHLKIFAEYLQVSPAGLEQAFQQRVAMYHDLGSKLTTEELHKAFSYALHKVLKEGSPLVDVRGVVETMLLGETSSKLEVLYESPILIEYAAFAMNVVWEKEFEPVYEEFLDLARMNCLFGHLKLIN
jgi:hypothetical protein